MSSRSFKYWPEVIGVAAAIMVLLLSSCVPEDKAYYYSYKVPRYQYCIDVEGKTYFLEDFSRNSIQFAGDNTLEFTDIDGVEYSFKNVSYCKRRIPSKPTRCRACGSDLTEREHTPPVKPTRCEACGSNIAAKEPPQYLNHTKCKACGGDLTVKSTKCKACGSDLTECGNPHPAKPIKCEACGSDLTGKEHAHDGC